MPARMPEIISESKKAWQNICQQVCQIDCRNLYIYKYCIYVCHNYFQMVCQKLCRTSVSGWGSLEVKYLMAMNGFSPAIVGLIRLETENVAIPQTNTLTLPMWVLRDGKDCSLRLHWWCNLITQQRLLCAIDPTACFL